jgi:hypothetical protein
MEFSASGQTPATTARDVLPLVFHFACRRGQLDFAKALVQAGCDVAATDQQGRTALMWAAENDQTQIVEWLLLQDEGQMLEARSRTYVRKEPCLTTVGNKTAFLFACRHGAMQVVALLAGASCDTAAQCAKGRTALMLASIGAHADVIEFLLQQPFFSRKLTLDALDTPVVDTSSRHFEYSSGGMSALLHACNGGERSAGLLNETDDDARVLGCVQALVHAGCDMQGTDTRGHTVLMLAAQYRIVHNTATAPC